MKRARTRGKLAIERLFSCFLFVLILGSSSQIQAKESLSRITEAYFGEDHSLIINTQGKSNLNIQEIKTNHPGDFSIYIADADLTHKLDKKFSKNNSSVQFKELRGNLVELSLKFTDSSADAINIKTIVDGLAYELIANTNTKEDIPVTEVEVPEEFNLQISKNENISKIFLNSLDPKLAEIITSDPDFTHKMLSKVDSITLSQIGDALTELGHYGEAYQAYNESLKLDSHNNQAQLGIANTTTNNEERVQNLINSIDSKALTALGEEWLDSGIKNYDSKQISQAFIPFQLAVLKEPRNPQMRFDYANILEKAGFSFYEEASKRYLEAAALAKELYLKGDLKVEHLMRKSAENLIRVACYLGKQEEAIKYCNSYLNLGFERFLDGRPVLGLVKEMKYNRNPFLKS